MQWDPKAAQVWYLEKALVYVRAGEHPDRGRILAECSVTLGSYLTKDGFESSVRLCKIDVAGAVEEVQKLSETMR